MRLPAITPSGYRRVTRFALLALAFIIVTGAAVRLTGSGLGCPDWPSCEPGSLTPRGESDHHDWIEFVNRTITGLVSIAVILAVLGAALRKPFRRDLLWLALGLVGGVLAQIVLGGLTVLFDLWPPLVMAHFLLSMALVWNAVWLHTRAGDDDGHGIDAATPVDGATRRLVHAVTALTAAVVIAGTVVTASGPHAGDADVDRLGPDLPDVARVHGIAVVILVVTLAATLTRVGRDGGALWRNGTTLLGVLGVQGVLGYTQYFTGVPALLVGFHVALATAVWVLAVRFSLLVRRPDSIASDACHPRSSPTSSSAPSRRPSPSRA